MPSPPEFDQHMMQRALALARRARGYTCPNPTVGAVVVRDGAIVGEGYHRACGQPHAEAEALARAGDKARGATIYITLEPCDHVGRTPSCTEAILAAGIKRVVVGAADPNPKVRGKGLKRLQNAGVEVVTGVLEPQCLDLNRDYNHYISSRLPWVTLKWAMTLDGKIATRTGNSRWISGEASQRWAHHLRARYTAVLVGLGTALTDDPLLTVRHVRGRQPTRIVLDSRGELPLESRLVQSAMEVPLWVAITNRAPEAWRWALVGNGVEVLEIAADSHGYVDIKALLCELGSREVMSVLVEGGSKVLGSFFDAGLWNQISAVIAPKLAGGEKAPSPFGGTGIGKMVEAPMLADMRWRRLGDDFIIEGYNSNYIISTNPKS
jgi:diaminohydroxyphosphoribosylaminopyrimidine deaminase / 5-amino-6-(5-phosphoribosylamino)uracil reductase